MDIQWWFKLKQFIIGKHKKPVYLGKRKLLGCFMSNSSTEVMRDKEVMFDSLITCTVTALELGGQGTRQYKHSVSDLAWFCLLY